MQAIQSPQNKFVKIRAIRVKVFVFLSVFIRAIRGYFFIRFCQFGSHSVVKIHNPIDFIGPNRCQKKLCNISDDVRFQ